MCDELEYIYNVQTRRFSVVDRDAEITKYLNKTAADGWELLLIGEPVATILSDGGRAFDYMFTFRRPVPPEVCSIFG